MPRVVAFIPDLLFGSRVLADLTAAGEEAVLVSDAATLERELAEAELAVVDLCHDATQRIEELERVRTNELKTLAFYAHVETEVRERAEAAGFDLVVPRSRMAREGPALVARLLAADG